MEVPFRLSERVPEIYSGLPEAATRGLKRKAVMDVP
jgi:hypothetical protein